MFDISKFRNLGSQNSRYERQLNRMLTLGLETEHIKNAVREAITNIDSGKNRS